MSRNAKILAAAATIGAALSTITATGEENLELSKANLANTEEIVGDIRELKTRLEDEVLSPEAEEAVDALIAKAEAAVSKQAEAVEKAKETVAASRAAADIVPEPAPETPEPSGEGTGTVDGGGTGETTEETPIA